MLDLEDAVAAARRRRRARAVCERARGRACGRRAIGVRINALASGLADADLEALAPHLPRIALITIPMVEGPDEVRHVAGAARRAGARRTSATEPARDGRDRARDPRRARDRRGLRPRPHAALRPRRPRPRARRRARRRTASSTCTRARRSCSRRARQARRRRSTGRTSSSTTTRAAPSRRAGRAASGFQGKVALHPRQLPIVTAAFAPGERELAWAREVDRAFREAEAGGVSSLKLADGTFVDYAVAARARDLLRVAGPDRRQRSAEPKRHTARCMKVERIRKAYEQVADQLLDMINSGELKPGDRLPSEAELAADFGVSRTTVREAHAHPRDAQPDPDAQGHGRRALHRRAHGRQHQRVPRRELRPPDGRQHGHARAPAAGARDDRGPGGGDRGAQPRRRRPRATAHRAQRRHRRDLATSRRSRSSATSTSTCSRRRRTTCSSSPRCRSSRCCSRPSSAAGPTKQVIAELERDHKNIYAAVEARDAEARAAPHGRAPQLPARQLPARDQLDRGLRPPKRERQLTGD